MSTATRRLAVMYDRDLPPEGLAAFARHAEALGLDDVWVVEDLGWAGGLTAVAQVLAHTRGVRVGLGIAPAPLRNPVLLAMELAALARMYPGRLAAGIGHGVPEWMGRAGAAVASPLSLLEDTFTVVGALLRGEQVDHSGPHVQVDGARLVHPPTVVPPLLAGVIGPRSLALSGRVADGTILVEGSGPAQVAAARRSIAPGTGGRAHEIVALAYAAVVTDPETARDLREQTAARLSWISGESPGGLHLPVGDPETVVEGCWTLWDAGVDTIVLHLLGDRHEEQLDQIMSALRVDPRSRRD